MEDFASRLASMALALLFAWAALAKVIRFDEWGRVLRAYAAPVPDVLARFVVPATEMTAAVLLLAVDARAGASLVLALVAIFSLAIFRLRSTHGASRLPCGCFGTSATLDYRTMLARNAGLAALSGFVVVTGNAQGALTRETLPSAAETLPFILVVVGLGLVAWSVREAATSLRRRDQR